MTQYTWAVSEWANITFVDVSVEHSSQSWETGSLASLSTSSNVGLVRIDPNDGHRGPYHLVVHHHRYNPRGGRCVRSLELCYLRL